MSESPLEIGALSAAVQRNAGPKAPAPLKMMTARGMAPMAPKDLVTAQFVLTFDGDEKVAAAASKSLAEIDERIANAILGDRDVDPPVLAFLALKLATNDAYVEKILLNPTTPTFAFVAVGQVCSEATCELIANNQARLLEEPEIARSLIKNSNALRSSVDRVVDFLVRSGVLLEDLKEFSDALLRLTGEDRIKIAQAADLPLNCIDDRFLTDEQRQRKMLAEEDDVGDGEEEKQSPLEIYKEANAAKKVALATLGNKEIRSLAMRDTNRVIALAGATSPLVTESEIIATAQSRTVHADVIAHIARDKKNNWSRIYQVKVGLVNNPKTPLPDAMKLVPTLNGKDLKAVSKSRNVPMGVRNRAAQLIRAGRR